jgi:hypothetical protein
MNLTETVVTGSRIGRFGNNTGEIELLILTASTTISSFMEFVDVQQSLLLALLSFNLIVVVVILLVVFIGILL